MEMLMRTITASAAKGGVGKTTTVANLAGALAELGHRVLMVDLDEQAHLTMNLDLAVDVGAVPDRSTGALLSAVNAAHGTAGLENRILAAPFATAWERVSLLAATEKELSVAQTMLTQDMNLFAVADLLTVLDGQFDFCVIDTPPVLQALTRSAIVASHLALPVMRTTSIADANGARNFADEVRHLAGRGQTSATVSPVLFIAHEPNTKAAATIVEVLDGDGIDMLPFWIPKATAVNEAAMVVEPITSYRPGSAAAVAYQQLASWLLEQFSDDAVGVA